MYLEFFLLIGDYFSTLTKRVVIYEWLMPSLIGFAVFLLFYFGGSTKSIGHFNNNVIRLLAVLAGFSITIIILIATGSSENTENIKKIVTKKTINGDKITLFRLLLTNLTYSVVVKILLIIFSLLYPFVIENLEINRFFKCLVFGILTTLVMHVLLLTVRNLTDFCLIITKEKPSPKGQNSKKSTR